MLAETTESLPVSCAKNESTISRAHTAPPLMSVEVGSGSWARARILRTVACFTLRSAASLFTS